MLIVNDEALEKQSGSLQIQMAEMSNKAYESAIKPFENHNILEPSLPHEKTKIKIRCHKNF